LGDYIVLEGGLEVNPYGSAANDENNGKISLNDGNDTDKAMRKLIVVGINSFRSGGGNNLYAKTENNDVDHVVFQFQNIPGIHWMNKGNGTTTGDNTGGV
jgi:hypothetical protein